MDEASANFSRETFVNYLPSSSVADALLILRQNAHRIRGCCMPCSCGSDCMERGDCCPAWNGYGNQHNTGSQSQTVNQNGTMLAGGRRQECVHAGITSYLPGTVSNAYASFYMVSDCFENDAVRKTTPRPFDVGSTLQTDVTMSHTDSGSTESWVEPTSSQHRMPSDFVQDTVSKCRQPNPSYPAQTTPVYSVSAKKIYKNVYCAECDGNVDVDTWEKIVLFGSVQSFTGMIPLPSTAKQLYDEAIYNQRFTDMFYHPPKAMAQSTKTFDCFLTTQRMTTSKRIRCEKDLIGELDYKFLNHACEFQEKVFVGQKLYRNLFCRPCTKGLWKGKQDVRH